jgi:hypothetical protein
VRRRAQVVARVLVLQRQRRADGGEPLIAPVSTGGVAGGEKFVVGKVPVPCSLLCRRTHTHTHARCSRMHDSRAPRTRQVFYKFATTAGGIYPCATAAQKAAALEITAMNAVVAADQRQLGVTLTALHMICGHCVIATARAPISGDTLVYGSSNAGHARTIALGDRCAPALPAVRDLAQRLGLAEHGVTDGAGREVQLWLPVDTEVHLGSDGRLYVVDLARLMPPVPPPPADEDRGNSYLFRHFRPEFLRRHPELALSSDAFSRFAATAAPDEAGRSRPACAWHASRPPRYLPQCELPLRR